MTFSYDLASTDAEILLISKVRLTIGDTTEGGGVRPSKANFTDEEILTWLGEVSNEYHLAAARAYEVLAGIWATQAHATTRPMSDQFGTISKRYAELAASLRQQYGESGQSGSVGFDRHDGYSISRELSDTGYEYGTTNTTQS